MANKKLDLEFVDTSRLAYQIHPIRTARETPAHFQKKQIAQYGKFKFADCPGMIDYKNYGYIIPAWDDIHILANEAGVMVHIGGTTRETKFGHARDMSVDIASGIFTPDNIPLQPIHITNPWNIIVNNKNVSATLVGASYHSSFLDDIYVYPGIVDYGNFTSANFIFAPRRACDITIKAGEPLLQVLPFETKGIKCGYGPASEYQMDKVNSLYSTAKQFYRKYILRPKPTTLELEQ